MLARSVNPHGDETVADARKSGIRQSIGTMQAEQLEALRPTTRHTLELEAVKANDLMGEVAKSRILAAAHDFMREQGVTEAGFDFSLSFSLSW